MFSSFSEAEFRSAVEKKDYLGVKLYIISAIRNDPSFGTHKSKSEVYKAINILENELPEIFVNYAEQEGEISFNENDYESWNREYFIWQTTLLKKNFSRERLNNIGTIGKKISNFQKPQEQPKSKNQFQNNTESRLFRHPQIIMGLLLLLLLVLVVTLSTRQR